MQSKMKRNIILALISCALVGITIVYLMKWDKDRVEQRAEQIVKQEAEQARLAILEEQIAKDKEASYLNYLEVIEKLVNSDDYNDVVRVAELSDIYLYEMNFSKKKEYFQQTQKGDEYLGKLGEEATKRLNDSLYNLYDNGSGYRQYDEIKDSSDDSYYVHEENLAFFKEEKDRFSMQERKKLIEKLVAEKREQNPRLGMTKEQVEASSWGKPEDINRTVSTYSSTEQWVYGGGRYLYFTDGILTSFQD